jgi:ABC-type histidine transport system ATPase subunit
MINELRQEGKEFIVVTHEMGFEKNGTAKLPRAHSGMELKKSRHDG